MQACGGAVNRVGRRKRGGKRVVKMEGRGRWEGTRRRPSRGEVVL